MDREPDGARLGRRAPDLDRIRVDADHGSLGAGLREEDAERTGAGAHVDDNVARTWGDGRDEARLPGLLVQEAGDQVIVETGQPMQPQGWDERTPIRGGDAHQGRSSVRDGVRGREPDA